MKWFYLKLGFGNDEAEVRLSSQPTQAVIYFGTTTVKDCLAGKAKRQAQDFCEAGLARNRRQRTFVVTCRGTIWILEPVSEVVEEKRKKHSDGKPFVPKVMQVRILKKLDYVDIPAVLAEIRCNAWLGRGTFREIPDWGNIKAIEMVLNRGIPKSHLKDDGPAQILECLSSVELETLVAKLFEAAGCFVEARRGGTRLGIDVVAHNDRARDIILGGVVVPANGRVAVQVKRWTELGEPEKGVDYLIGFIERRESNDRALDAAWLLEQARRKPSVSAWLRRSLHWLPSSYLDKWSI